MENILENYADEDEVDLDNIDLNYENNMLKSIESEKNDQTESMINITESIINTISLNKDIDDDYVKVNDNDSSSDTSSDESLIYHFRKKKISKNNEKSDNEDENDDDDDDDDDDDENVNNNNKQKTNKSKIDYPKTKGELTIDEIPVPEFNHFQLNETEIIEQIGIISSIVNNILVVQSNRNSKPLDEDTILFTNNKHTIGKIYETFGPVCQPYYSIRINNNNNENCKYEINTAVYYVPNSQELTKYIFNIEQLKTIKGSDASWSNDNEPPIEFIEYSDDEEERLNRQRLKQNKNQTTTTTTTNNETVNKKSKNNDSSQQQKFRTHNNNHSFRQQFFIPQAQLINQSFQQMISPNIYNMMPTVNNNQFYPQYPQQQQQQQQRFNQPRIPFNRPFYRPNFNLMDQRYIQNNDIKKSF